MNKNAKCVVCNKKNAWIISPTITDKAIYAELENGLVGMIHYKEISYKENIEY